MAQENATRLEDRMGELATFYVGEALCGMDILKIQEINKLLEMTIAPTAPEYVKGILNLRGQIVTVIDLGRKLGLSPTKASEETRNIVVHSNNECIGLLVDRIGDVVRISQNEVDPPPANMGGVQGRFFEGVFKTDTNLIGILDVEKVLVEETAEAKRQ